MPTGESVGDSVDSGSSDPLMLLGSVSSGPAYPCRALFWVTGREHLIRGVDHSMPDPLFVEHVREIVSLFPLHLEF
jgi:hypothetical protein